MRYRSFGKIEFKPSALGFGAMRLPVINNNPEKIDEPLASEMIFHAIDSGVNYIDTAYPYHRGQSEVFLGKLLKSGYRDKVKLATKMPSWLIKTKKDFDKYYKEQTQRLQTDRIDFYLIHSLNKNFWENLKKLGVIKWLERARDKGLISHFGFSFHDEYPVFKQIVDDYDSWEFCQIQYNYMDIELQAGRKGFQYAAERGIGMIVMEPLRGGQLAKNPAPESIADLYLEAGIKRTPADLALQWLWNQPETSFVLSGMSTLDQVKGNLQSACHSGVGTLSQAELALVDNLHRKYRSLVPIPCTSCNYCQPCPETVKIPTIFDLYNDAITYNDAASCRFIYNQWIKEENRANRCSECGKCETLCPQGIAIINWLKKAGDLLKLQS